METKMPTLKITESTRQFALKRPLVPSVTKDEELAGLSLIVTTRRAFWAQMLQPRGLRPDGKRWAPVRHELGDARTMTVQNARSASLAAKLAISQGKDPHRERLDARGASVARRLVVPTTATEAAGLYAQAISARARLSPDYEQANNRYVRKAIRLMKAEASPIASIDVRAVRLMLDATKGSDSERRHVFGALSRFMAWCVKHELIESNPCLEIDHEDRPRPGRSRDHTPPVATLRRAWDAVESARDHARALIHFLLLVPLRREEAQGLLWSEVDLDEKRITIRAERMKGRQAHSLPLSEAALAILSERPQTHERVFAPPSGARTINWEQSVTRIRVALGENDLERPRRFSLHDVRRSFVSALAERGFDVDLLDQCLGHSRRGTFGVYQRSQRWREKEAVMAAWAELIVPSAAHDNVVRIRA
jgi:integrase